MLQVFLLPLLKSFKSVQFNCFYKSDTLRETMNCCAKSTYIQADRIIITIDQTLFLFNRTQSICFASTQQNTLFCKIINWCKKTYPDCQKFAWALVNLQLTNIFLQIRWNRLWANFWPRKYLYCKCSTTL